MDEPERFRCTGVAEYFTVMRCHSQEGDTVESDNICENCWHEFTSYVARYGRDQAEPYATLIMAGKL
jgi:hypothetical protein